MLKRIIVVVLLIACAFSQAACSGEWRKKFIREKKGERQQAPVFTPESYDTEFSMQQRYANHYAFWKNAVAEVINMLDGEIENYKKLKTYASHALDELRQLNGLLLPEIQQELAPSVQELADATEKIHDQSYVNGHASTLAKQLRHHYRVVTRTFSYSKMKHSLREPQG